MIIAIEEVAGFMPSVGFYTLGCKANQSETKNMENALIKAGFKSVEKSDKSVDFLVINTCCVTQNADKKSRNAIRQALKSKAKVIITGCYAELFKGEISKIPGAYLILKNEQKQGIENLLSRSGATSASNLCERPVRIRENIMIENGCNQFCSYCIVPFARGSRIESKPESEIMQAARSLSERGTREIILTGINLGLYPDLPGILNQLSQINLLQRIRLSSLEPRFVTAELIRALADNPKLCQHLHLPLQSGDDSILKRMNRNYSVRDYFCLVDKIRDKIPAIGISTDIIAGFPGEGEKEFQQTLKTIRQINFSRLHIFGYSRRKPTRAYNYENEVGAEEIKRRSEILKKLRSQMMLKFKRGYLGREVEVLAESENQGLTGNYLRVKFPQNPRQLGKLLKIKIKRVRAEYLEGVASDGE